MSVFGVQIDDLFEAFTENKSSDAVSSPVSNDKVSLKTKLQDIKLRNSQDILKRKQSITEEIIEPKRLKEREAILKLPFNPANIKIRSVPSVEGCLHEVAVPQDFEYKTLQPAKAAPAKVYPFTLDPFQREALLCIENNESVLVSAHTSAGKTVCAEYAIAKCLRDRQRVIYTTPIKALSNQKYREFLEEFKEVGLMTGDVTINPTASVLIMTTEILRSMLYKGSDILREVGWVVFDEIHYMRDKIRGVVWEETIILLPHNIHCVFLSATIPNAGQFAQWISSLHNQPCHVVYTDYRPVPLQHYVFPCGGDGIYLVVDEQGAFREDNFNSAMQVLRSSGDNSKSDMNNRGRKGGFIKAAQTNCLKLIQLIMSRDLQPIIVFSFAKRECEAYALQLKELDFNTESEKASVELIFKNVVSTLSEENQRLPQVETMLPLLKRGVGIHHSGLLPLLKETVEILFSEGLIKCLFATETFAMGLNMPARTVLYTAVRKFDGTTFRLISSGEYIQMSGRAGRRGKDDKGTVILMLDQSMTPGITKEVVKGDSDPLNSAFHLTYNMIVNLLRVEEINPEYLMQRSFFQFQNYAALPGLWEKESQLEEECNSFVIAEEDSISSYKDICTCLQDLNVEKWKIIGKPKYLVPFLMPGRLIKVFRENLDFGWSVTVGIKKGRKLPSASSFEDRSFVVRCLIPVSSETSKLAHPDLFHPPSSSDDDFEWELLELPFSSIYEMSAVCIKMPNGALEQRTVRRGVGAAVNKVQLKLDGNVPLLDPKDDIQVKDDKYAPLAEKIKSIEERLKNHRLHSHPNLPDLLSQFSEKRKKVEQLESVQSEIRRRQSLLQLDELKSRKRVLRRLGFCSEDEVISLKGRVACEISTADELLLTELLLEGTFTSLSAAKTSALLSCFVFDEKVPDRDDTIPLDDEMQRLFGILHDKARFIARVSRESRLELDEDKYVTSFQADMMMVVQAWAQGCSFYRLCQMTPVFEGSIIRCMRRLEDLLRQMHAAAKSVGNTLLEATFAEAMTLIKRDIIFAASLYL